MMAKHLANDTSNEADVKVILPSNIQHTSCLKLSLPVQAGLMATLQLMLSFGLAFALAFVLPLCSLWIPESTQSKSGLSFRVCNR
jgi:hypothetical protein